MGSGPAFCHFKGQHVGITANLGKGTCSCWSTRRQSDVAGETHNACEVCVHCARPERREANWKGTLEWNGDGHLKNFGVIYSSQNDARLAPMFDVVTTSIYKYSRYDGGEDMEDRTMALKLFSGKHASKAYPTPEELLLFGRDVCGVSRPEQALERIGDAMASVLHRFRGDERIPASLLRDIGEAWTAGLSIAIEAKRRR